jgi:uncharacterized membrane protein YheB (UPF0754 family)
MSDQLPQITALVSIPIVSALIGYVTNFIAVKMIFRPQLPKRFFGITFQGLIPKRQREIAQSIAKMIERDLISHRDVQDVLKKPETLASVTDVIATEFDGIVSTLAGKNPVLGMLLQGEVLSQVKSVLMEQVHAAAPRIMDGVASKVEGNLDFRQIVQRKIEGFDLGKLESLVYEISARELRAIEVLGGVLGFFVGLAQIALMWLVGGI